VGLGLMVEFVIRVNQQRTAFTLEQETSREIDYGNCSELIFGLLVQPLRVEALVRLKRFNSNIDEKDIFRKNTVNSLS